MLVHVAKQEHLRTALGSVVAVHGAVGTEVLMVLLGSRSVELHTPMRGVFTREPHQLTHLWGKGGEG